MAETHHTAVHMKHLEEHFLHYEKLIHEDSEKLMGTSPVNNIPPVVINLAESDSDESEFEFVDELG